MTVRFSVWLFSIPGGMLGNFPGEMPGMGGGMEMLESLGSMKLVVIQRSCAGMQDQKLWYSGCDPD